jgi:hypothetical protein
MANGACNRGAVALEIGRDLSGVIVCHCSICRRATADYRCSYARVAADYQGPPPVAMCIPFPAPVWDPAISYGELFMGMLKDPQCDDPDWSPTTDAELRSQTNAVMDRRNVFDLFANV